MERSGLRFETFSHKGCTISAEKKMGEFCLTKEHFFGIGATIHIGREILCLPYAGLSCHKGLTCYIYSPDPPLGTLEVSPLLKLK